MKKFLSLLLALLFCLSFIVSCDKEETHSSSRAPNPMSSSSDESSTNDDDTTDESASDYYSTYKPSLNEGALVTIDNVIVLTDYESYLELMNLDLLVGKPKEIDEQVFSDNFVLGLYGLYDARLDPKWSSFKELEDGFYTLNCEYENDTEEPFYTTSVEKLYLIVIPKNECGNPLEISKETLNIDVISGNH